MDADSEPSGYMSQDRAQENAFEMPRHSSRSKRSSERNSLSSFNALRTPPSDTYAGQAGKSRGQEQDTPSSTTEPSLDPRHFTPSLHASLVSEILGLRRELESKSLSIDGLESTLADTRAENEALHDQVARNARESRTVKKQLQSIEESTLSAIESLAKERDEANGSRNELRRRAEELQKRSRAQDDDAKRANNQFALDKAAWLAERRTLERRVTVAESRLRSVLNEVTAADQTVGTFHTEGKPDTPREPGSPEMVRPGEEENVDAPRTPRSRTHKRQQSSYSTFSGSPRKGGRNVSGLSLAEELAFDEEDGEDGEEEEEEEEEEEAQEELRASDSQEVAGKPPNPDKDGRVPQMVSKFEHRAARDSIDAVRTRPSVDARRDGSIRDSIASLSALAEASVAQPVDDNTEANQARRRNPPTETSQPTLPQDADVEDAPELTPEAAPLLPAPTLSVSVSTQTEWPEPPKSTPQPPSRAPPPPPPPPPPSPPVPVIPIIAIHAPESTDEPDPGTGKQMLPPNTKSLGCQTDFTVISRPTRSTSTQTEGIRIDTRIGKIAPHLLPSALSESVASFRSVATSDIGPSVADTPSTSYENIKHTQLEMVSETTSEPQDFSVEDGTGPGVDSREAEEGAWARLKKAFRSSQQLLDSSRIPNFDLDGDVEDDGEEEIIAQPIRSSFRSSKYGRPAFDPPTPVPEDDRVDLTRSRSRTSVNGERPSAEESRHSRAMERRRSGLHSKSPSNGSAASSSNFSRKSSGRPPIPPRGSSQSRHSRFLAKSGYLEQKHYNFRSEYPPYRLEDRATGLRKARSTALMRLEDSQPRRDSNLTGSAKSESPLYSPASGMFPPVPIDSAAYRQHTRNSRSKPYLQTYEISAPTGNASVGPATQYSVVDAITSTMIGEWMWKYVRKRKSFGVADAAQEMNKMGEARHRRWVWLSPYDRTIMWSSKQPTSNAALMGKAGRKLEIQSVLDVKDDTPPPKSAGHEETFSRSILILTPARALKFTATTRERHYLWLTALSFLSQQNADAVTDIKQIPSFAPPPNSPEPAPSSVGGIGSSRGAFASVRSSIGRTRSSRSSGIVSPTVQTFDPSVFEHRRQESGDVADAALPPSVPRIPKHMRKRSSTNPTRGRAALTGLPSTAALGLSSNQSTVSTSIPSARHSRTPSIRRHGGPVVDQDDFYQSEGHFREPSPRPSNVSADFGGNNNFFDAGGLVRMTAFVSPGMVITAAPGSKEYEAAMKAGHQRGKPSQGSGGSFEGPPPIGLVRRGFGRKTAGAGVWGRRDKVVGEEPRGFFSADEA